MSFCTRCICCMMALWFSSVLLTVCVISLRVSVMVVF
ncbi:putative membrane protein, partial [Escherichia coli PA24]